MACSVVMRKKAASSPAKKPNRGDDEPSPCADSDIQIHRPSLSDRVISVEPEEQADILVGVLEPTPCTLSSEQEVLKVSVKEWRERAGCNKRAHV